MNTDAQDNGQDSWQTHFPRFRLFILGAGFSKAAGHPLGIELLEMVRKKMRQNYRNYGWDGPLEEEISEWTALYPNNQLNLESVLAYSHRKHFLKLIGSDEYFGHGSRSIASARSIIQEILSRPIAPEAVSLYRHFAGALTPTDVVLTFNYDTVLEDTLDFLGKPYSLTPEWWLQETPDNSSNKDYKARFIDILKLHGSIDWYDRKYYDDARAYHASTKVDVPDRDCLFGPNANVPTESLARGAISDGYGEAIIV